jgi:hypothetical protein
VDDCLIGNRDVDFRVILGTMVPTTD